eukprot:1447646-Amphidinium_carterae.1
MSLSPAAFEEGDSQLQVLPLGTHLYLSKVACLMLHGNGSYIFSACNVDRLPGDVVLAGFTFGNLYLSKACPWHIYLCHIAGQLTALAYLQD